MKGDILGGRYRLDNRLAEGGMGEVWRAHDELLGRDVAVKLLRGSLSAEPVVVERFRREARSAASLSHRNMANVFDYVEEGAQQGIVMELVGGETLADRIARAAPMRVDESVRIMDQVLDALGAAHAAGIIHRDMKPGNVMIAPGEDVKVADFGIARALGDSTLTETGSIMGSVHYLAPEQLTGATVPASDLYSAGAILFEMLTAHKPFEGGTPVEIAMRRLNVDAPRPSAWRGDLPPSIEATIVRALQRDPNKRFGSAAEMREALDGIMQPATPIIPVAANPPAAVKDPTMKLPAADATPTVMLARSTPKPTRPPRQPRIGRRTLIALLVGALLLVGIIVAVTRPPATVSVPRFTGLTFAEARTLASQKHVTLVQTGTPYSETVPKGSVITQSIAQGKIVKRGASIGVVVSNGPRPCCTTPDLSGQTPDDATASLTRAGLVLGTTACVNDPDQTGLIVQQSPVASASLAPGSSVSIVISGCPRKGHGKGHD